MEISLLAIIGIGLATMFFGYFFGLFEGRGQGYKRRKKEEEAEASVRPSPATPIPPPSSPTEAPRPAIPSPDKSLLRLALDPQQQLCLDMDGQRIDTANMDPQQRRRLIDLMVLMRPWIESGPVQRAQPAPPPAVPTPAASSHRPTVPPFESPPPGVLAPGRVTGPLAAPPPPGEPAPAPTTMVGQIDAILQTKLIGTPLASRGIRLVESAQGGAMVVVGVSRYAGVGEVPDPDVQAVIRAAIAEWENKYTPG